MELPAAADSALLAAMMRALLRAIQDNLQDSLNDDVAAAAFVNSAPQAIAQVSASASPPYLYALSVGLPPSLQLPGAAGRRGLAGAAAGQDTAAALGGLLSNGYFLQRCAELGLPDCDALFSSGALSVSASTVAPPTAAPAPESSSLMSAATIIGIVLGSLVFLILASIGAYLYFTWGRHEKPPVWGNAGPPQPAAVPDGVTLQLRETHAHPSLPDVYTASGAGLGDGGTTPPPQPPARGPGIYAASWAGLDASPSFKA